ncbi:MAG TPA: hypothetical protein DCM31_05480 [Deferribacteraceae bacterium]|nr:hypothetical protein [Deferribacteraceae bacterium]
MSNKNQDVAEEIDLLNVIALRGSIYNFLSRGFSSEIDHEYLEQIRTYLPMLRELGSQTENKAYKNAVSRIASFMESLEDEKKLTEDYARRFVSLFLNISNEASDNINPFESVYLSPERLVMQEPRDQVVEFYAEYGHGISETFHEPEDHIAAELSFLGSLNNETVNDINAGKDLPEIIRKLDGQLSFIHEHLLKWLPALSRDLMHHDPEGLYGMLGELTFGFTLIDASFLADLSGHLKTEI